MNDTPRADTNGVVATIHRDGYWTNKMPEQDPFPYLSQHGPIEVCLASELAAALEENAKLAARVGELEPDARRLDWLASNYAYVMGYPDGPEKGMRLISDPTGAGNLRAAIDAARGSKP